MGLDIYAFETAEVMDVGVAFDDVEDIVRAYTAAGDEPWMDRSLRGLIKGRSYRVGGAQLHFRAGSYSGYGEWRRELCRAALGVDINAVWQNPMEYEGKPFYELLNFGDNEGTIGPEAAADLAADFEEHAATVRPQLEEWFQQKYDEWHRAFKLASPGGLVLFA